MDSNAIAKSAKDAKFAKKEIQGLILGGLGVLGALGGRIQ